MNLKTKIFVLAALSLFSVSLVTFPVVTAYTSDSFSQKVGDESIWEIKATPPGGAPFTVGGHLKLSITVANKTIIMGTLGDTLYADMYINSVINPTWQLLMPSMLVGAYNSTYGMYPVTGPYLFFIPHNQTAVNSTLFMIFGGFGNYIWTSGPHGYDGTLKAWMGSAIGDLGMPKYELQFNANGVMQYMKEYNGTGSGWTLISHFELWRPVPAPPILNSVTSVGGVVILDWTAVEGATMYYIYRSTSEITSLTGLTAIGATTKLYYVDQVAGSGTYYYVVQAGNSYGNSTQSNCKSVDISGGIPGFTLPLCLILLIFLATRIGLINFRKRSVRLQEL